MFSAFFKKRSVKINTASAFLLTLVIDIKIVKEIGFAFLPLLLMSLVFFLISFLSGMLFILIVQRMINTDKDPLNKSQ